MGRQKITDPLRQTNRELRGYRWAIYFSGGIRSSRQWAKAFRDHLAQGYASVQLEVGVGSVTLQWQSKVTVYSPYRILNMIKKGDTLEAFVPSQICGRRVCLQGPPRGARVDGDDGREEEETSGGRPS